MHFKLPHPHGAIGDPALKGFIYNPPPIKATPQPFPLLDPAEPAKYMGRNPGIELAEVIPELLAFRAPCLECDSESSLYTLIQHLNDEHEWTREAIADWLDTLEVDLTFKMPGDDKKGGSDEDVTDS